MKKLFTIALGAFTMLQGCTVNEAEVAPANILLHPAGVSIESAVKSMKGFILENYKAILLKPVDNDPNTNLTTFYIANAKGGIMPVIENFEVKDVRVTRNGIYVLTNYLDNHDPIAFFVKYDNTWVQLKEVDTFIGEDDNGNIVFQNQAILNTQNLQVDRSLVSEFTFVESVSGNLSIRTSNGGRPGFSSSYFLNHVTNYGGPVHTESTFGRLHLASFKGTDFVLLPATSIYSEPTTEFVNMKSSKRTIESAISLDFLTADILRLDNGSIVGLQRPSPMEPKLKLTQLSVKENNNGEVIIDRMVSSSVEVTPDITKLYKRSNLFGSDKYYIFAEADKVKVFDKSLTFKGDVLNGLSNATFALVDALVYYSGTKDGQPVSGVYNLDSNQNTVLDKENMFTTIQPL